MYRTVVLFLGSFAPCATVACVAPAPVLDVQRFADDQIAYYAGEGGVVVKGKSGVCVMPPAQAAREVSGEGEGKIAVNAVDVLNVDLAGSGKLQQGVQKLYDQSQGNLFLQFALYRLCEAAANGLISKEKYWEMAQRTFDVTTDLLRVELQRAETAERVAVAQGGAKAVETEARTELAKAEAAKAESETKRIEAMRAVDPDAARKKLEAESARETPLVDKLLDLRKEGQSSSPETKK